MCGIPIANGYLMPRFTNKFNWCQVMKKGSLLTGHPPMGMLEPLYIQARFF